MSEKKTCVRKKIIACLIVRGTYLRKSANWPQSKEPKHSTNIKFTKFQRNNQKRSFEVMRQMQSNFLSLMFSLSSKKFKTFFQHSKKALRKFFKP